jgi:peptide/nickel transport system permease protein
MKDDNLTVTVSDTGVIEENAEVSPQKPASNRADATPFQLMSRRFHRHRIAVYSGYLLIVFYLIAIFCEFISPLPPGKRNVDYLYAPPQPVRIFSEDGRLRAPFVYGLIGKRDPETAEKVYTEDRSKRYPIKLFPSSEPYHLWGVLPMSRKLFGVEDGGTLYLLGADSLGRDLFSRICHGARVSLSIGLVGVALSFALGLTLGSISGFYGGAVDNFIQRTIEVIQSFPNIPLWMALAAALPSTWSPLQIYFGITVVLSLIGWTGLARQVRGKILALREEDFCTAALLAGVGDWRVMWRHLLPSFVSHIIVTLTLAIPSMILAETALSFLGLGLQPPVTSWGVLLTEAQNVQTVAIHPWLLTPVVLVIMTVLAFNFLGDGMRDAADPHA